MTNEADKLQQHLSLLREQYVRLQERCIILEQKLSLATATQSVEDVDSFLVRLLKFVASLYDKEEYSDVVVKLCDGEVHAHRFVLAARGDFWGVASLADVDSLDWLQLDSGVGIALLKWVYTDHIQLTDHQLTLKLIKAAAQFKLDTLVQRCEEALIGWVNVKNCVQLYTISEEIGADALKAHCSSLISTHWNDFTPEDFCHMTAPLLYSMFKSKTQYLLHAAVRLQREDVLFLYLIEFDSQLSKVLNKNDDTGRLALDLALENRHASIAATLLNHGASVNAVDNDGHSLLHCAVRRGDAFSCKFLLDKDADVRYAKKGENRLPLHVLASSSYEDSAVEQTMAEIGQMMIDKGADPNAQDVHLKSSLHLAIENNKSSLFSILVSCKNIKLNSKDKEGFPPLWYALIGSKEFNETSFASSLIERGAPLDEEITSNGNTILHHLAQNDLQEAGVFLTEKGASPSVSNRVGETPLHLSCTKGLPLLTEALLKAGADPNAVTLPQSPSKTNIFEVEENPFDEVTEREKVFRETPLHCAIREHNVADINAILNHKKVSETQNGALHLEVPSLDLQNSQGLTSLGVAVLEGHLDISESLLTAGANIDYVDPEGHSLLHRTILLKKSSLANFLLQNNADPNIRTMDGLTPMELCIQNDLPEVVEGLCKKGADLSAVADSPLWLSLEVALIDIANILVKYGVDVDSWHEGPEGCLQTLLHRSIDENREDIACFLVRNCCSVNVLRKEGSGGRGSDVVKELQTPLHMCSSWGLIETAKELISFGAKINAKDFESKTPLHYALENNHEDLINFLLDQPGLDLGARDQHGHTPFSVAMTMKNNKSAQAILHKHPAAAEQYDHKGMNFLHCAIQKGDLESVLFLLSIHISLTSRTKDDRKLTPLHLATLQGNEMVVRNLLLAGAGINELTQQKQTCLHLSCLYDHPALATIFIQNMINVDALDDGLNNSLHVAMKEGHLASVRVLLTESQINAGSVNLKGQNCLHVLSAYPKDNAAAIAQLFLETMPEYPLDKEDVDGNTALLLAYMRGAGQLCRVLVKNGACLGVTNKQGVHLFNYEVATKALLRKLLDAVASELPWSEGEWCLECGCKFGLATRRHHCRHCGRLLCGKCSGKDVPILKFGISKPVRVCQLCFNVLTLGPNVDS